MARPVQLACRKLRLEASIAYELNPNDNCGPTLSPGFTDKQPELMQRTRGAPFDINRKHLHKLPIVAAVSKRWTPRYINPLMRTDKLFAKVSLLMTALSTAQRKPADLASYMDELLANNSIKMYAFGNYDKADLQLLSMRLRTYCRR